MQGTEQWEESGYACELTSARMTYHPFRGDRRSQAQAPTQACPSRPGAAGLAQRNSLLPQQPHGTPTLRPPYNTSQVYVRCR